MLLSGPRHTQVVPLSVVPGGDAIGPERRGESLRVVVGYSSANSARISSNVGSSHHLSVAASTANRSSEDGATSHTASQVPVELTAEAPHATINTFVNNLFIENTTFPRHVQDATSHGGCRQCWGQIVQMITSPDESSTRLMYPLRFRALVSLVVGLSAMWLSNYFFVVMPTLDKPDSQCKYDYDQLRYNAKTLLFYFAWFMAARLPLFMPCVASRVVWVHTRANGFCHTYYMHLLLRDGPLYVLILGSLLFWFQLMQSLVCEERSPSFYRALKLHAIYSNLVSVFCLILGHWHNRILAEAFGDPLTDDSQQRAPTDTIHKLHSRRYDEAVFGDEEEKLYPSECAICLGAWEANDLIKVTPCSHAFHEECIGNWLQNARTCALCRKDLVALTSATPLPEQVGNIRTREGVVGVEDV